jgi:hypothetical protein
MPSWGWSPSRELPRREHLGDPLLDQGLYQSRDRAMIESHALSRQPDRLQNGLEIPLFQLQRLVGARLVRVRVHRHRVELSPELRAA